MGRKGTARQVQHTKVEGKRFPSGGPKLVREGAGLTELGVYRTGNILAFGDI